MSNIDLLNDGDTGLQARTIINSLVNRVNTSGASGTSGTSGQNGADGAGINFIGGWLNTDPYGINDVVQYGNPYSVYIAKEAVSIGESNPSINSKWTLLIQSGTSGTNGATGAAGSNFPYTGTAGITGSLIVNGIQANELALAPTFVIKNSTGANMITVVGSDDVFIGNSAGGATSGYGYFNTAVGSSALGSNEVGSNNTAIGGLALGANTEGMYNIAIGSEALGVNTTGNYNVVIGSQAGLYSYGTSGQLQNASDSVYVGYSIVASSDDVSNEIVIGSNAIGQGSNTVTIGNDTSETLYFGGLANTGIVLASPDGTKYRLSVANGGTLNIDTI
jgi:hypothetical protein